MKRVIGSITLLFSASLGLFAQEARGQVHAWVDTFGGSQGAVLYPQYGWSLKTSVGSLNGFGFMEVAPHEPLFTNHLVVFTPGKQSVFSVQTETGAVPNLTLGFHQIGPRVNIHALVPKLKKPLHHLFVTALPRFIGIRPNNLLLAGASNRFTVAKNVQASVEGYRRFFAGNRPDYAEYWFLVHPKATGRFSFAVFGLQDGDKHSIGFGTRLSLF
ncbi:MAG: hypothetical protein V4473_02375 [Patescibacteria group bacterium]